MVVASALGLSPPHDVIFSIDPGGAVRLQYLDPGGLRIWTYNADVNGVLPADWHSRDYVWPNCSSLNEQLYFVLQCLEAEAIHEVRERFKYNGCRIYDPHGPGSC